MSITKVSSPKEWRRKLSKALKDFMEKNKRFNVQGSWEGDDGVTVTVLADFSIEDLETGGDGYVISVSATFDDNQYILEKQRYENMYLFEIREELSEKLAESETLIDAENEAITAIRQVFKLPKRARISSRPERSGRDVSVFIPVQYGVWETRDKIADYRDKHDIPYGRNNNGWF